MLGYIKIYADELRVRSLKLYRSVYCGLCKTSEKRFGYLSKMFLSYDYTFFAIVRMIFRKTTPEISSCRCGFKLFSKKSIVKENEEMRLSASIFSILTYYKLLDNVKDEGLPKRFLARLLLPYAAHMRKKVISEGFGETDLIVSDCIERISNLEKRDFVTTDEISSAFGDMLGCLLCSGLCGKERETAYRIGSNTGKFIYICDALDDLSEDEKKHRFNPLLKEYGSADNARKRFGEIQTSFFTVTDEAADILSGMMSELSSNGKELCEIALNILYLGCPSVVRGILCKGNKKDDCKKDDCKK